MKHETLKNCISTLEKVRSAHSSQLDARVLLELDDVIKELKKLQESNGEAVALGTLSYRTLRVISQVISLVCNIADLMK